MASLPTIVVGLFVYGLIVVPTHAESGFAGAVALAIVMLPLISRSSQEVLLLVPGSLREAADALGVSRWRTVRGIILPAAMGGIAHRRDPRHREGGRRDRAAPHRRRSVQPNTTQLMIFGHGVPNIPLLIFTSSEVALPEGFTRAWGAALVLLAAILLANIGARVLLARSRTKMGR